MANNTDSRQRSKIEIMGRLFSFVSINSKDWHGCFTDDKLLVGDLVAMNCSSVSKWYLSWLLDIEEKDGWTYYLLKSVEDGEASWWHNVGLEYYDREIVSEHPEWKWTDKQWEFKDKWFRACYKRRDCYANRPNMPKFNEDGSVVLTLRKIFNMGKATSRTFPNWKKLLVRDMLEFYDSVNEK